MIYWWLQKPLFAAYYINISNKKVIPNKVHPVINKWPVKTFEQEWQIEASEFPSGYFLHREQDQFDSNSNNLANSLHNLPSLISPCFFQGCFYVVKNCNYFTYMHYFCTVCCKQKFKLEVKHTTNQLNDLKLFASLKLEAKPNYMSDIIF